MTLRSDLIAARALIDTPEKMEAVSERAGDCSPLLQTIYDIAPPTAGSNIERFTALWDAVVHAAHRTRLPSLYDYRVPHADVMVLFQRAIDNAGELE